MQKRFDLQTIQSLDTTRHKLLARIFNWGDCFRLGCIGPEEVHGFGGLLSMIGTDILLALLINVATGELCKAFAFHIAKPLGGAISCGARPSSRITRPYIHACRHTNTSYTLFGFILQSIYI